jgi:hypothetical protein
MARRGRPKYIRLSLRLVYGDGFEGIAVGPLSLNSVSLSIKTQLVTTLSIGYAREAGPQTWAVSHAFFAPNVDYARVGV